MKKISVLNKKQQYSAIVLSVVFSFFAVWMVVSGATTIGTNVTTGGTMTVSGLSTLTGFISSASSTVSGTLNVAGALLASTTLQATGATTLNSTLNVTGLTTLGYASTTGVSLTGNLMVNGMATTTGSSGDFATKGTITVVNLSTLTGGFVSQASSSISSSLQATTLSAATSSTAMEVNVDGGSGTSTVRALSGTTARGGCIELGVAAGGAVRIYATSTVSMSGTANGGLIVESGHCE